MPKISPAPVEFPIPGDPNWSAKKFYSDKVRKAARKAAKKAEKKRLREAEKQELKLAGLAVTPDKPKLKEEPSVS